MATELDAARLAEKTSKVLATEGLTLESLTVTHKADGVTVTLKATATDQLSLLGGET